MSISVHRAKLYKERNLQKKRKRDPNLFSQEGILTVDASLTHLDTPPLFFLLGFVPIAFGSEC